MTRLKLNHDWDVNEALKISPIGANRNNKLMIEKMIVEKIHKLDKPVNTCLLLLKIMLWCMYFEALYPEVRGKSITCLLVNDILH